MNQESESRDHSGHLRPRPKGRGWILPLLIALALVLRLGVFTVNVRRADPRYLQPDSFSYLRAAESLARNGAILDRSGDPTWGRVPVYPALLAVFFRAGWASPERLQGAILFQVLLGALVVFLAARLAGSLGGAGSAIAVAGLLALEPSGIAYSNVLLSEVPYTVGLLLSAVAWREWLNRRSNLRLVAFAFSIGILSLIRPVAVYLPLAILPLLLMYPGGSRRPVRVGLIFGLVALLPAAAWTLRNYEALGSARLHYTGPWAQAMFAREVESGLGIPSAPIPGPGSQPWDLDFGTDRNLTADSIGRLRSEYFRRTVWGHPLASARILLWNGVSLVGVPDSMLSDLILERPEPIEGGSPGARMLWLVRQGPLLGILLVLGMALSVGGMVALPWLAAGRVASRDPVSRAILGFLAVIVIYHVLLSSLVGHQGERYRVPIIPALAILFVLGFRRSRALEKPLPG